MNYLEMKNYENVVYALGDCASIPDPTYRKTISTNSTTCYKTKRCGRRKHNFIYQCKRRWQRKLVRKQKKKFDYKTKGMMAQIGKRTGVAILFGKIKLHGFLAWWLWRSYYLANLPTIKKKLKVMGDWTSDLFFKPDVSQVQ